MQEIETLNRTATEQQKAYWAEICQNVKNKKITMNQAYKYAQKGYSSADGNSIDGFIGSFQLWIDTAVHNGWVENGLNIVDGVKTQAESGVPLFSDQPITPEDNKPKVNIYLGIAIATVLIIGVVYYYKKQKEN